MEEAEKKLKETTKEKKRSDGKPFAKGQSGNPGGRPKGAKNKATGRSREIFQEILEENLLVVKSDLKALEPKDRIRALLDIAQYCIPKLQATSIEANVKAEVEERMDITARMAAMYRYSSIAPESVEEQAQHTIPEPNGAMTQMLIQD